MTIEDVPSDLLQAIAHATTILNWFEHLPEDEIPPSWMWHLQHELKRHFERVKQKRKHPEETEEIDGPVIENEYARSRRGQMR